jgi:hypothetical protein
MLEATVFVDYAAMASDVVGGRYNIGGVLGEMLIDADAVTKALERDADAGDPDNLRRLERSRCRRCSARR